MKLNESLAVLYVPVVHHDRNHDFGSPLSMVVRLHPYIFNYIQAMYLRGSPPSRFYSDAITRSTSSSLHDALSEQELLGRIPTRLTPLPLFHSISSLCVPYIVLRPSPRLQHSLHPHSTRHSFVERSFCETESPPSTGPGSFQHFPSKSALSDF